MTTTSLRKISRYAGFLSGLAAVMYLFGCTHRPPETRESGVFIGLASWYGSDFHNKKTASGERFSKRALTAAHPFLPFGTKVKVTHLANGRAVIVRINDRGPFVEGRIIDLSYRAARILDMIEQGIARVRVEVLD